MYDYVPLWTIGLGFFFSEVIRQSMDKGETASSRSIRKKLVVVGDDGCDKTCLLVTFAKGVIGPDQFYPTVFESDVKDVVISGKQVELFLVDTSGEEDYVALRRQDYERVDVLVICFALDNRQTFDNATELWTREVKDLCPGVPFLLVGHRRQDAARYSSGEVGDEDGARSCPFDPVSPAAAKQAAKNIGAAGYFECSPSDVNSVKNMFQEAARIALQESKKRSPCCCIVL